MGLENVRRTVEAYQGTMQCEIVGEEYRVSVMLPGKGGLMNLLFEVISLLICIGIPVWEEFILR